MQNHSKFIFLWLFLTQLVACGNNEIPSYILTDSQLHTYQGGDRLSYSVLSVSSTSDATGILNLTFENADVLTPDNQTLATFVRNQETLGNISVNFATPYFTQTENADLILQAYSEAGKTYWLAESQNAETGKTFYSSPLTDITEQVTISSQLLLCENTICNNAGNTSVELTPLGKETIETDYAKFETHKMFISWSVTLQNDDQSATLSTYNLTGTQWVFPPLGVVKFDYRLESTFTNDQLIGVLNATNINIPSANKSEN